MNRIKFHVDEYQDYPIDKHSFEAHTQHSPLYYRKNASGEICQFAICPACNGPAQIIGLYRKLANTDKPYGKHVNYAIQGLADYIQENYDYCPFRAKRAEYHKNTRKLNDGGISSRIVQKLVTKFDKIVFFISKFIGIYISDNLAKSMLDDYFSSRAYLYPGSTLINIPLMLAYFMRSKTLLGRIVTNNELENVLSSTKGLYLNDKTVRRIGQNPQKVNFYFLQHETKLVEHKLTETIFFEVSLNGAVIFRKKLVFDSVYAENLMNYNHDFHNEKIEKRNSTLLDIAKSVAADYGFTFD